MVKLSSSDVNLTKCQVFLKMKWHENVNFHIPKSHSQPGLMMTPKIKLVFYFNQVKQYKLKQ